MEFSMFGILAVVLELLRPVLLPLALVILADALLYGWVIARHTQLRIAPALRASAIIGLAGGVGAALYFPVWTGASIAQLSSLLDYAAVVGAGIGMAIAFAILIYPPVQLLMKKPS